MKVLDLLAQRDVRLSEVVAELPRPHLVHETVVTPWEQKGTVMRTLVEQSKDREVVLVDGVKVLHDDGWALALPDPEEPVTHVWAEADSDAAARRLAEEYARRIRQMIPSDANEGRFAAMNVPEDLRYSTDHEWVRLEGDQVRVGITDYAQDALGDVVFVEVPEVGAEVEADERVSEVESTKSVSDIYAPVAGTIVEVNTDLADSPERLNEDPYGEGWICVIEPDDPAAYEALLDAAAYRALIEE